MTNKGIVYHIINRTQVSKISTLIMVQKYSIYLLLALVLCIGGCGNKEKTSVDKSTTTPKTDVHTAQNSLDWVGVYQGVTPCASCEGIEVTIELNKDNSYSMSEKYLGEEPSNLFESTGDFSWNDAGNTITLSNQEPPKQYFVGERYLLRLDTNGEQITGDLADFYRLEKQ
jgi:uncharacterized lipoprotein NlpE involved in copper resistance